MPERRKGWIRRAARVGGKIVLAGALVAGFGLAGRNLRNHYMRNQTFRTSVEMVQREMTEGKKPLAYTQKLTTPFHFAETERPRDWCAMYVRLAAQKAFGNVFMPGDAWQLADRNRSVWKMRNKWDPIHGKQPVDYLQYLKPGYALGVYNPGSHQRVAKLVTYTHVVIYMGHNTVWHRYENKDIQETIPELLRRLSTSREKAAIIEVVAPLFEYPGEQ